MRAGATAATVFVRRVASLIPLPSIRMTLPEFALPRALESWSLRPEAPALSAEDLLYLSEQLIGDDRFLQEIGPGAQGEIVVGVARYEKHARASVERGEPIGELQAVHLGQREVRDQEIERLSETMCFADRFLRTF